MHPRNKQRKENNVFGFLGDIVRVVAAPVKVAAAVVETAGEAVRIVTKPVADVVDDAAKALSNDVRSIK